jgi:hypothetical protein
MYSDDGGATFTDHRPGAQRDAHCLAWHPEVDDRAYEAAGGGAAWSRDGGRTWDAADRGRDLRYCWALAVDPGDPERWYVSAASGPGAAHAGGSARGRLYRWHDGAWEPYALAATDGELLAGLSDGRLLRSDDRGDSWHDVGVDLGSMLALAAA